MLRYIREGCHIIIRIVVKNTHANNVTIDNPLIGDHYQAATFLGLIFNMILSDAYPVALGVHLKKITAAFCMPKQAGDTCVTFHSKHSLMLK